VDHIFEQWMAPLKDLGVTTITNRNTGGTDHLSFDAVGIPGFQFIQDPMDYETRTHHSNMDTHERLQAADLKQIAVVEAIFVYNAAMRDRMIPRKPFASSGKARRTEQAAAGHLPDGNQIIFRGFEKHFQERSAEPQIPRLRSG